jgi:hypothetical protein
MPGVALEPTTFHALDRAATVIRSDKGNEDKISIYVTSFFK